MSNYYITRPGDTVPTGPMSLKDLQDGVASGRITQDYLYCAEGGVQWVPVSMLAAPVSVPKLPGVVVPPMARPANQLVWSVVVAMFCCLPAGIYTIIKSASVDTLWMSGQYAAARAAADEAKKWNLIGLVASVGFYLLYFIVLCTAGFSGY